MDRISMDWLTQKVEMEYYEEEKIKVWDIMLRSGQVETAVFQDLH